jgi:hypothetical protein
VTRGNAFGAKLLRVSNSEENIINGHVMTSDATLQWLMIDFGKPMICYCCSSYCHFL